MSMNISIEAGLRIHEDVSGYQEGGRLRERDRN